jgi:Putative Ig domain
MKRAILTAFVLAVSTHIVMRAQGQLASGRNVNITPGIGADQFTGDLYLQRKVEPKAVCASNGPQNCLAIANDYRWVDGSSDIQSGFGEAKLRSLFGPKGYLASTPGDAWLGLYRTSNGGESWVVGGVPGFLGDTTALGMSQPWYGLAAGSDGGLATDGVHFYGVGLFFNRNGTSMIGTFRLTNYNDESTYPIRWDAPYSRVLEQGSATATGQFADLPSIINDPQAPGTGGCGITYVAYTLFAGAPTNNSFINFSRTTDCGQTWLKPKHIPALKQNQRVVLTVNPKVGTPTGNGGGTLWAIYRTFGPDMIVGTRSLDYGNTWSAPIPISALNGPSTLCTYDQPTIATTNDGDPADQTARSMAFAWPAFDSNGNLHIVWPERVAATGFPPASPGACTTALQPKIVYTRFDGTSWTLRRAIDMATRCETVVGVGQAAGLDRSSPNGTCPAGTASRPSGPQLQPVLTHSAGKLMLLYDEGRLNPDRGLFLNNAGPSNGYHAGRNTEMDVRAARIGLNGVLLSTTQVSRYIYDVATNDIKTVDGAKNPANAKAYNRPYVPQYKGGTTPFKGDHEHMTPAEDVVWGSPPHYATQDEVPGVRFFGIWGGDTRETLFPFNGAIGGGDLYNGNWSAYVTGGSVPPSCNAGMRYSNNYWAYVGSPTEAFAHQSFKPPSGIQHTWAVTVRNRRNTIQTYKYQLEETGTGGTASFHQFLDVETIGNTPGDPFCANADYPNCTSYRQIPPQSSMTFTVYGTIQDATVNAPIKVKIFEAGLSSGGTAVDGPLAAIVRLNPNKDNPAPVAGGANTPGDPNDDIATHEHHGPSVEGPFVKTFPTQGNPTQGNPTQGNPTQGNPTQGNPTQGAAGFGDYTDYTYKVRARDANTLTQYSSFANVANADTVDQSHISQIIITRPHKVATLNTGATGCPQTEYLDDEVISMITLSSSKDAGVPTQGNPTQGNPTQGNPTQGNPTQGNPTQGANTFALSPQNTPLVGTSASAAYRATAIASAIAQAVSTVASSVASDGTVVTNPDPDEMRVTLRFYHCDRAGDCGTKRPESLQTETVPRTCTADPCGANEAASNLIGFVTTAGAGDNDNGVITDPKSDTTGPPDLTIVSGPPVPTNGVSSPNGKAYIPGETINFPAWTERNIGGSTANPPPGTFSHGYYLSADPIITAADTLLVENVTNQAFPPQTQVTFSAGTAPISASQATGIYSFGIFVDNHNNIAETNESNNFVSTPIVVCPAPSVTTSGLPNGTKGQAYNQPLSALGGIGSNGTCGSPSFSWTMTGGILPPGLTVGANGTISGTPTASGTYTFTVQATDQTGHSAFKSLSITINQATLAFLNTDIVMAGVGGMRAIGFTSSATATGSGNIVLSGIATGSTITKAFLYWNGPTISTDPTVNATVSFNAISVTGFSIGFASSNCWDPAHGSIFANSQSYRADVTAYVAGNGTYALDNFVKRNTNGDVVADINGVSLIVFFNDGNPNNNRDVYLVDGNDSNEPSAFEPAEWDTTVSGVSYSGGTATLTFHVTDGQVSVDPDVFVNGTQIFTGETFNGGSVPNADTRFTGWDIVPKDVTSLMTTSNLRVTSSGGSDCIGIVVLVLSVQHPQPIP